MSEHPRTYPTLARLVLICEVIGTAFVAVVLLAISALPMDDGVAFRLDDAGWRGAAIQRGVGMSVLAVGWCALLHVANVMTVRKMVAESRRRLVVWTAPALCAGLVGLTGVFCVWFYFERPYI